MPHYILLTSEVTKAGNQAEPGETQATGEITTMKNVSKTCTKTMCDGEPVRITRFRRIMPDRGGATYTARG